MVISHTLDKNRQYKHHERIITGSMSRPQQVMKILWCVRRLRRRCRSDGLHATFDADYQGILGGKISRMKTTAGKSGDYPLPPATRRRGEYRRIGFFYHQDGDAWYQDLLYIFGKGTGCIDEGWRPQIRGRACTACSSRKQK